MRNAVAAFNKSLKDRDIYCFTSDIDWASEYAVSETLGMFAQFGIKPTFFVTHKSVALEEAAKSGAADVGIHPNFMPDSSQGKTFSEVIDFCMKLVPGAEVFRSHRYFEVNDIVESLVSRGIKCSSNICSMMENVPPYVHRCGNISFPVYFEDGAYLLQNMDLNFSKVKGDFFAAGGLKVINVHPMHMMLNTPYFKYTRDVKDRLTRDEWRNLDAVAIAKLGSDRPGIRNFVLRLCEHAVEADAEIKTLKQLYAEIESTT